MWGKKKLRNNKVLTNVRVEHYKDGVFVHHLNIYIPVGAIFHQDSYGSRATVVDQFGNSIVHYDWQAGHSQKYIFKYASVKGE